jgi:CheY-like chemotaxis protein
MAMSGASQQTAFVSSADACERWHLAEEVHDVPPNGDAVKCNSGGHRSLRIVVVDDNRDVAESFSKLLERWGHVVQWTCDGASALKLISVDRPDVMLLDFAMPEMDGCDVAREVRRQRRFNETLLIAVSGYADEQHRRVCAEAGFDQYLVKPVDFATLEALLLAQQTRAAESLSTPLVTPRQYGILIADDEGCVRSVLNLGMRQRGFAVWLAADGREALDLYQRHREAIDVVLLDVQMPGADGPWTLAALQELDPRVRCCFMSADPDDYAERGLRNLGAFAVIPKPFRLAEVTQMLWETARGCLEPVRTVTMKPSTPAASAKSSPRTISTPPTLTSALPASVREVQGEDRAVKVSDPLGGRDRID